MFHILSENSTTKYLVSDWDGAPSTVVCGAPSGQRRDAITLQTFNRGMNANGKVSPRLCKACAKKIGVRVVRQEALDVSA